MFTFRPDDEIRATSTLKGFLDKVGAATYEDLAHRADVEPEWFWQTVLDHVGTRLAKPWTTFRDISEGPENIRWAIGAELNITATLLDRALDEGRGPNIAVEWMGEDGARRSWSYRDLAAETNRIANALAARGVGKGDAVGLFMPMLPETYAGFLAIARLGGVVVPLFSGFQAEALRKRLDDADARAVLTVDAAMRRGAPVPMLQTLNAALANLPGVHTVIILRRFGGVLANPDRNLDWAETVGAAGADFAAVPVPSDQPLMIIYTSGTTGRPKGVIHTHLGPLAKCTTDFVLALDMKDSDKHLWMSDMGWMVGPFSLISSLLAGGTVVCAEGAPSTPEQPFRLLEIVEAIGITHLGLAPSLVRQFMTFDPAPLSSLDLSSLRILPSSGEAWTEDAWMWHLQHIARNRAVPMNISGGTELFGAILTQTLLHDVRPGGFSAPSLGCGARVFRADGTEAAPGEMGELVVTVPPLGLTPTIWKDKERYLETYWSMFPGVWRHGDWARRDADGTWFILGRSDDTLNIGGKRIGPPEIENALTGTGKVVEAAAVAVPDPIKGEAVAVVCIPAPGVTPDAALVEELRSTVAREVSKPFAPRDVHFIDDLPRTRSMKIMRRIVRHALLGADLGDTSPMANPEVIEKLKALAANKGK